jgi:hypothetical protein
MCQIGTRTQFNEVTTLRRLPARSFCLADLVFFCTVQSLEMVRVLSAQIFDI